MNLRINSKEVLLISNLYFFMEMFVYDEIRFETVDMTTLTSLQGVTLEYLRFDLSVRI